MDWFINGALFGLGWTCASAIPVGLVFAWLLRAEKPDAQLSAYDQETADREAKWTSH